MPVRKGEILIQQYDLEQTVGVVSEEKNKTTSHFFWLSVVIQYAITGTQYQQPS